MKKVVAWIVERASYSSMDAEVVKERVDDGRWEQESGTTTLVEITDKVVKEMKVISMATEALERADGKEAYVKVDPIGRGRWALELLSADGSEIWRSRPTNADVCCVRPLHGHVCKARVVLTDEERARFAEIADLVPERSKSDEIERFVASRSGAETVTIEGGY